MYKIIDKLRARKRDLTAKLKDRRAYWTQEAKKPGGLTEVDQELRWTQTSKKEGQITELNLLITLLVQESKK